jgi:hypothetical protein
MWEEVLMAQCDVLCCHLLQESAENNEVIYCAGQKLKLGPSRYDEGNNRQIVFHNL